MSPLTRPDGQIVAGRFADPLVWTAMSLSQAIVRSPGVHGAVRRARSMLCRYALAHLPRDATPSDVPVSIFMPLAVKDIRSARNSLEALRLHLQHPIEHIVVAGQSSPDIAQLCADNGYRYIDENTVLPANVRTQPYRNGWIRQQMLKLMAIDLIASDNIFICDSDTMFIRNMTFIDGRRQVLLAADDYVPAYHAVNDKLVGPMPRAMWSFVAHCMLFQRDIMAALRADIETRHGLPWHEAILANLDKSSSAGFSEYELYANYALSRCADRADARYWYNRKAKLDTPDAIARARTAYRHFTSLSQHIQ